MATVVSLAKELFVRHQVVQDVVAGLPAGRKSIQDQGVAGSDHLLGELNDFGVLRATVLRRSQRRGCAE